MLTLVSAGGGWLNKVWHSPAAIWIQGFGPVDKHFNVLAVLGTPSGRLLVPAANIVSSEGEKFYAQRAASETVTNSFIWGHMCDSGTTPVKAHDTDNYGRTLSSSAGKLVLAAYPKTNDVDADNTGGGVQIITWCFSYSKTDFASDSLGWGLITTSGAPGAAEILTAYTLAATVNKTANDTFKVFVNHTMNGV